MFHLDGRMKEQIDPEEPVERLLYGCQEIHWLEPRGLLHCIYFETNIPEAIMSVWNDYKCRRVIFIIVVDCCNTRVEVFVSSAQCCFW